MFVKKEIGGVVLYTSDMISSPHAFSTRYGGVSRAPHTKSMNFGFDKGDTDEEVLENYRIFTSLSGVSENRISARQVHSSRVVYAESAGDFGDADGFYTDKKDVTLVIKTADCLPVIVEDAEKGIIGAFHAGWRGIVGDIQKSCIEKMIGLGADPKNIKAAIGPSIHPCHFEVSGDFVDVIGGKDAAEPYIKEKDGRLFCDLQAMCRDKLVAAGLLCENIDISPLCTACDTGTFFSHRIMGNERGLMCTVISMK